MSKEQRTDGDAQTGGQAEEVPSWAASFQQTMKDISSRMDAIEAFTKGGVPSEEQTRTTEAKDAGNPGESAGNGEEASRMFSSAERAEEGPGASFAGEGKSPVTASQGEQESLQRSKEAGPAAPDKNLENGVISMNTSGQERQDLRGHGEDKTAHHMDAILRQQQSEINALKAQLGKVAKMPTIEERNEIGKARRRADSVYSALNRDVPEVLPGESPLAYRRRLADGLKDLSPTLKKANVDALPGDVFGLTEERIYADALEASKSPANIKPMELRAHKYQDEATGHMITEYHGDPISWMQTFMAPGARLNIDKNAGRGNTH